MADALPTRVLGRTGVPVTQLGYGAMELRGADRSGIDDAAAAALLNAVLDAGITFIDTSIDYGESEEIIGRSIAARRNEYFLATKCGCAVDWTAPPVAPGEAPVRPPHTFTRANIVAGVEQSLRRMKTEHLDLVQFHAQPSRDVLETEQSIEALRELQRAGKVRFIGMSSTLPVLEEHVAMGVFDAFQIPYSAVQREHEAIIGNAAEAGAGIVIRGGAARGAPAPDKQWVPVLGQPAGVAQDRWIAADMDALLEEAGMSRMEFTVRFTLSHPAMHTTIIGTRQIEHLRQNVAWAARGPLPDDVYAEAQRRLPLA